GVERLLPPGERLPDRLGVVEVGLVRGEMLCLAAVAQPVSDADRQLGELREHVQLRQRQRRDAVDPHRVAESDEVEPAAAPLAAGDRAELAAQLAQPRLVRALDLRYAVRV